MIFSGRFSIGEIVLSIVAASLMAACSPGEDESTSMSEDTESTAETAAPDTGTDTDTATDDADTAKMLRALAEGDHRSAENKARNDTRHPVETLMFFGLEPDMTVVELIPATGWYTEIIAPFVNEEGQYYGANYDPNIPADFIQKMLKVYNKKLESRPDLYGNAEVTALATNNDKPIAPEGSADMVVTFRNLHDFITRDQMETVLEKVHAALKPGGVFGVVEYREDPEEPQEMKEHVGYVREDYAIEQIEAAGFELVEASEINANPKDTKDWKGGAFGVPDKIGAPDRFTLKFRKPEM